MAATGFRMSLASALAFMLAGVGCGDDSEHTHHGHDAGGHENGHAEHGDVPCDGDEDALMAGTQKDGNDGHFAIEILDAEPMPHRAGQVDPPHNVLGVRVLDAEGEPVPDAEIALPKEAIRTTAHGGHDTAIDPEINEESEEGELELTRVTYAHGGPWTLDFEVSDGEQTDSVQFKLCIAPNEEEHGGDAGTHDE